MNVLEGLLIAYALLGFCCAAIEVTEGYAGESIWFAMGGFITTLLLWPVWICITVKETLNESSDDNTNT